VNPRSEPLLWLQLVALGAIPLELVLLLLVLAGADPGPLPGLERVLLWGLGVLAPGLLLWRRPADCGSLLLVQVPAGGRSPLLRHLNALQRGWPPRILLLSGAPLLLGGLWILDSRAALAAPLTPLADGSRLVSLMLAAPLLALLLWQWQQLGQALWLLSRSPQQVDGAAGSGPAPEDLKLLSLGLPLLLLPALQGQVRAATPGQETAAQPGEQPSPAAAEPVAPSAVPAASVATSDTSAVTIEPEQASEEHQSGELDQQID
jgi:hypothetical protein